MGAEPEEWMPKTRDDWVGIFADGTKTAHKDIQSEAEEAAAKAKVSEEAQSDDKTGKGGSGDDSAGKKRKSVAERLLGL